MTLVSGYVCIVVYTYTKEAHGVKGPDDRGLATLMARLKGSKRTCEQLLVVFRERAAMEEDYAKRLTRLSKTFKSEDEEPDV